eukprot:TRINITY_DN7511_c0_g1_i1.p2 TRINITY_DN7511_c0_g1~~TRINITY_DN7511_c0_g1_i1.p2  ORF type:complete len:191 (-),score=46.55 TRINITY_DN7511_c0_g1_i1:45-617(-)
MSSPNRRKEGDLMKLMMSDYNVTMCGDSVTDFTVLFKGPKDSPYEGGVWKVRVELPPTYPYKSPSIGFLNRIYHPNVDEHSGSVCLDVINQTWSPMFDLVNVFEVFLPQLLLYPNPTDPLNGEAAALLLKQEDRYKATVRDYVRRYASAEAAEAAASGGDSDIEEDSSEDLKLSEDDDDDNDILNDFDDL